MQYCYICNQYYSGNSYGGPGVCPSCDCGLPPINNIPVVNGNWNMQTLFVDYETKELLKRIADALEKIAEK